MNKRPFRFSFHWKRHLTILFLMVLSVLSIRYFVFHVAKVKTWSMFPHLYFEDTVLIFPYVPSKIERGTVLALSHEGKEFYLQRVVALPEDEMQWQEGNLILNDSPLTQIAQPLNVSQEKVLEILFKNKKKALLKEEIGLYRESLTQKEKPKPYLVLKNHHVSMAKEGATLSVPQGHLFLLNDNRTLLNLNTPANLKQNLLSLTHVHGLVVFRLFSFKTGCTQWRPLCLHWKRSFRFL